MRRAKARGQDSPVITRRAEAPRQNSCVTTDRTKATNENISSDGTLSAASVSASSAASASAVASAGNRSTRRSELHVTRRQVSTGPIPASSTSTSASGVVSRLNQGGPTLASVPVKASEISGKKVPQKITTQSPTKTRLFSRKKASRERRESRRASERRSARRLITSA